MWQYYNYDGSLDHTAQNKQEMAYICENNYYNNVSFYDAYGNQIPYKVKWTIGGTTSGVKISARLNKLVACVHDWGQEYYVGKGSSLLKIIKNLDYFSCTVCEDGKKKKFKITLS